MRGSPSRYRQASASRDGLGRLLLLVCMLLPLVAFFFYKFGISGSALIAFDLQPDSFFSGRHRY